MKGYAAADSSHGAAADDDDSLATALRQPLTSAIHPAAGVSSHDGYRRGSRIPGVDTSSSSDDDGDGDAYSDDERRAAVKARRGREQRGTDRHGDVEAVLLDHDADDAQEAVRPPPLVLNKRLALIKGAVLLGIFLLAYTSAWQLPVLAAVVWGLAGLGLLRRWLQGRFNARVYGGGLMGAANSLYRFRNSCGLAPRWLFVWSYASLGVIIADAAVFAGYAPKPFPGYLYGFMLDTLPDEAACAAPHERNCFLAATQDTTVFAFIMYGFTTVYSLCALVWEQPRSHKAAAESTVAALLRAAPAAKPLVHFASYRLPQAHEMAARGQRARVVRSAATIASVTVVVLYAATLVQAGYPFGAMPLGASLASVALNALNLATAWSGIVAMGVSCSSVHRMYSVGAAWVEALVSTEAAKVLPLGPIPRSDGSGAPASAAVAGPEAAAGATEDGASARASDGAPGGPVPGPGSSSSWARNRLAWMKLRSYVIRFTSRSHAMMGASGLGAMFVMALLIIAAIVISVFMFGSHLLSFAVLPPGMIIIVYMCTFLFRTMSTAVRLYRAQGQHGEYLRRQKLRVVAGVSAERSPAADAFVAWVEEASLSFAENDVPPEVLGISIKPTLFHVLEGYAIAAVVAVVGKLGYDALGLGG